MSKTSKFFKGNVGIRDDMSVSDKSVSIAQSGSLAKAGGVAR